MKINENHKAFLLKVLVSIAILIFGFLLIDLYVPIKRLLFGESLPLRK
jgi:hypothetical protein